MTTRHMRSVRIVKRRRWWQGCIQWSANRRTITAPVAVAFTEAEVQALAAYLRGLSSAFPARVARTAHPRGVPLLAAVDAILAAADDIESKEEKA